MDNLIQINRVMLCQWHKIIQRENWYKQGVRQVNIYHCENKLHLMMMMSVFSFSWCLFICAMSKWWDLFSQHSWTSCVCLSDWIWRSTLWKYVSVQQILYKLIILHTFQWLWK